MNNTICGHLIGFWEKQGIHLHIIIHLRQTFEAHINEKIVVWLTESNIDLHDKSIACCWLWYHN